MSNLQFVIGFIVGVGAAVVVMGVIAKCRRGDGGVVVVRLEKPDHDPSEYWWNDGVPPDLAD